MTISHKGRVDHAAGNLENMFSVVVGVNLTVDVVVGESFSCCTSPLPESPNNLGLFRDNTTVR